MSLIGRKSRPLARMEGELRDSRLFFVACDDTHAPKQYFGFFNIPRIKVFVIPTEDGTSVAEYVLERLLSFESEEDDEFWMLLDTDHCIEGTHFRSFIQALQKARRQGVQLAISKPSFEIWLLLHHVEESSVQDIGNAKEAESRLRKTLGAYNKVKLCAGDFPIDKVLSACESARALDAVTGGSDRPATNTSRVYKLWDSIRAKSIPAQLPDALKGR